jgi:hypothetical protein
MPVPVLAICLRIELLQDIRRHPSDRWPSQPLSARKPTDDRCADAIQMIGPKTLGWTLFFGRRGHESRAE